VDYASINLLIPVAAQLTAHRSPRIFSSPTIPKAVKLLPLRPQKQYVIAENQQIMSLKKQFLKSKPVCKVTFTIDPTLIEGAKEVAVLGDFNNWDPSEATMRKLKDGSFTKTIELGVGSEYQFRYLVDGTRWINDSGADKFVHSGVAAEENGVVTL
jgi:hypothetical protein